MNSKTNLININTIFLNVITNIILYIIIPLLSALVVSADEENPKSNNSTSIFKQGKTDKKLGESCLWQTECSQTMHLTCLTDKCECEKGYQRSANDTCVGDTDKNGLVDIFGKSTMLPILIVLAIMFVGICVVLHLFSRARFRKSRSIFVNPQILKLAKAQERRASQLSQMSQRSHNGGIRSPNGSYRSPRNSIAAVSPTHSHTGKHCYGNHILDPRRSPHSPHSPHSRSRSNSTSSLQMHLRA